MKNPTVREIVKGYLEANGYDGLYHENDCGCDLDDLAPCCDDCLRCTAAYKHAARGEYDWIMCSIKGDCSGCEVKCDGIPEDDDGGAG